MVINANGPEFILKQFIQNGYINSDEDLDLFHQAMAFHQRIFDKFVEAIPAIAKNYQNCTIVLRPHPGDDIKVWNKLSINWPDNVVILYEGSVSPWILASKVLVHNSCSTGVEAFAMGKPAIAYMPFVDDRFDQNIPNPLSQQTNSIDGILKLIKENLRQKGLGRESHKIALYDRFIKSNNNEFASARIVDALKKLDLPEADFSFTHYGVAKKIRVIARKAKRRLNDLTGKNEFSYAYRKQKNPGVTLSEVNALLESYKNKLHLWLNVNAGQVEEKVFCFYKTP
jgi:hypothetical protein